MTSLVDRHAARAAELLPEPALLIGDDRITKTSSGFLERTDPSTGLVLAEFPVAGRDEVDRAVATAKAAFRSWRRVPADRRRRILSDCARAILAHEEELGAISALEIGTPVSGNFLGTAADQFDYYAGWADKFEGELISAYPTRAFNYVKYEPYGVIGALITWNGPLVNMSMKVAPALAAGNTVVLRTPEQAPFGPQRLGEILLEAGLPAGVLNIVAGGPETSEAIIRHPDVRKVSFTGGPEIAKKIMTTAAETLTPLCLELGGKSANLVFADADLDRAAEHAARFSVLTLAGQGCVLPTRLLVQDTVYDEMVERVKAVAESPTIGDPLDPATTLGPVISQAAVDRILGFVAGARSEARVVTGGERLSGEWAEGFFLTPTVVADVEHTSTLAQQEVFGPVLAIMPFHTEEEAVAKANDTAYGLGGYLHTSDLARAHRVADELEAGVIGVNGFPSITGATPFGGTKISGFGREGGRAGIEEFVHHKNVWIPLD
ncbi:aldehyde dehydrogenase family protein [Pseudonocardia halophobica]|uniref:Betaine-aldehyde dehydrogenase n=1 Tax=Pseudonocardia halophobica TaxID=29401 RepID=A0A9W6NVM3_9PSEU|nr:aldehyde dehydrogenase family protein [Pseudonocardia halophobica]GLL10557.1 betaine-aldehyde dehydrogenase [Pseudonocardia halophobica]